jgi:hypothetical protein
MAGAKRSAPVAKQGPLAAQILARFGAAGDEVTVERLESELVERERYDIVAALQELQKAGAGAWVGGRKGGKARFVWSRGMPASGKVTTGSSAAAAAAAAAAATPQSARSERASGKGAASLLDHSFHVRQGVLVTLRLPVDVTKAEIERLCQFLQAIPFS